MLKRFKPIKKRDIRNIINEVSDHGDSMSKDLIHGKIQRIHRILKDLEDEEEKASE